MGSWEVFACVLIPEVDMTFIQQLTRFDSIGVACMICDFSHAMFFYGPLRMYK